MIGILFLTLIFIVGCSSTDTGNTTIEFDGETITMYKDPSCGCCEGYAAILESSGFNVDIIETDVQAMKSNYGIPEDMTSCHTSIIGDYFVEGHVPVEAIEKLLAEHPDIDGISLAGMPSGSPGMAGTKRGSWNIYSITDGESEIFMTI